MYIKSLGIIFALFILGCGNEINIEVEEENKAVWNESNWNEARWQ